MKAHTWVCLVLLSTAAVCSCRAQGIHTESLADMLGSKYSAQLAASDNPGQQLPDRTSTQPAAAAAPKHRIIVARPNASASTAAVTPLPAAVQQAARVAGNATAPAAQTPAEPAAARQATAGSIQRTGSASNVPLAKYLRNWRLGPGAARRAGLRTAAGRRLGQRLHARPAMHSRRTATAAHDAAVQAGVAAAASPAAASASARPAAPISSSSSSSANTTARAAAVNQQARKPGSNRLQAHKYFQVTDLTGSKAIEIGTTLTWREGQLLRPAADSASRPSDWKLVKVEAGSSHQKSDTGSVVYWVTTCGYLQWLRGRKEVQYTAEVDGCSEVINYSARRKDDPEAPTQSGVVLVAVGVDNCVYSHCEQAGCGSACKCMSKQTGECGCGNSRLTGFAPYYNWAQNRQSCAYNKITVVPDRSSSSRGGNGKGAAALFEARRSSGNVVIPIRFGNTPSCLLPRASRRLQVHSVNCSRASSKADASQEALLAKRAAATAEAGSLQGGCNRVDGTYLVVVGVPSAAGHYKCSVTFNDDWEDRPLAELRVT